MFPDNQDRSRIIACQRKSHGFTLTEMLIVIVIIAILAALLFPLSKRIRENAKSANCMQNLRQIGIGLNAYITDKNGRFPNGSAHVSWPVNGVNKGLSWYDAASLLMGRTRYRDRMFNDPEAEDLPDCFGCPSGHGSAHHPAWPYTGDYAANILLGNDASSLNPLTISVVKNPSSTPYVQDTVNQNNFGPNIFSPGFNRESDFAFAARHNGRGNILWVDGHVSSLTYDEYMNKANDPKHGNRQNFLRGDW